MNMNVTEILRNSNSWKHFRTHVQSLDNKGKGDSFEALTKYYLQLNPTYSSQLQNVWLLKEVPPKIHRHLNLPDQDEGIDLVAETKDGGYWAIQSKFKEDETKSLTRRELSTFTDLAFTICQNIEFGLVCTTADRFSHKLELYGERLGFCSGKVWRGLNDDFFNQIHKELDNKTIFLKPLEPFKHQKRAISNAYKHFVEEGNTRGKLIMPCGAGKSLAAYWIAEKLGGGKGF